LTEASPLGADGSGDVALPGGCDVFYEPAYLGVQIDRKPQLHVIPVELALLRSSEIVFLFHVISMYCCCSFLLAFLAENSMGA